MKIKSLARYLSPAVAAVPVESKINVPIMSQSLTSKIHIFITVDLPTIKGYFNPHDPSPLYKKELNQQFEEYILNAVDSAKRYSAIFYKLNCPGTVDRQYAEPLMFAIHRHFAIQEAIKKEAFTKFKKRNFLLLLISCIFVMICQALIFWIISEKDEAFLEGIKNCLDVFSYVLMWRPLYDLLFLWNTHLKTILLFRKLATAEVIIVENKKSSDEESSPKYNNRRDPEDRGSLTVESLLSNRMSNL